MFTVLLLAALGTLFAAEPLVGTWQLNPARSSGVIPAAEIVSVRARRGALLIDIAITEAGPGRSPLEIVYSVPATGGAGPVDKGPFDGVVLERISGSELKITYLTGGIATRWTRVVVSKNRSMMTSTGAAVGSSEPSAWTMVFERQQPSR